MIIQYLGTAAAEGWPALFCDCDNCRRAWASGGKNIRTRSQALIDGKILIDFPADSYYHILKYRLDMSKVDTLIFTHSHSDHFYPGDLNMFCPPFGNATHTLTVYSNSSVYDGSERVRNSIARAKPPYGNIVFKLAEKFRPFYIGKYKITPLKADHDPTQDCLIFIVDDGSARILYANDTGYFPEETWAYISGMNFNLVSLDCTFGYNSNRINHMSVDVCAEVRERLLANGCGGNTKFVLNHFSHNGGAIYDELLPSAEKLGFDVSFDGKTIEL